MVSEKFQHWRFARGGVGFAPCFSGLIAWLRVVGLIWFTGVVCVFAWLASLYVVVWLACIACRALIVFSMFDARDCDDVENAYDDDRADVDEADDDCCACDVAKISL